jgi:site-specific recombinase XerD
MAKHNAANTRIKREYFHYLKEARRRNEASIDQVARALDLFDEATGHKDFKRFHREQAVAFKRRLANEKNARTGKPLSRATVHSTLSALREFFIWLAGQPGYKSRIAYCDADYFNLSEKDVRIAKATREKPVPTVEQIESVLAEMPTGSAIERRDRALIAFAAMTGARVNALASFQLGHVNLAEAYVEQDARVVRTKYAKTFRTYFMPVIPGAEAIVTDWIAELRTQHLWGEADPLFPATAMGVGENGGFQPQGLAREGWKSTQPIREIFRRAFAAAGLPYFNPHSLRQMLVRHAMQLDLTPAEMKAWSQNLGHEDVLTTLTSYGRVPVHQQGELIRTARAIEDSAKLSPEQVAALQSILAQQGGAGRLS